jgi:hypothetical protein
VEKQNRTSGRHPASTKKAHYVIFEFIAILAGHLRSPYETITFYYGIYSSSYRGKERKEKQWYETIEKKILLRLWSG